MRIVFVALLFGLGNSGEVSVIKPGNDFVKKKLIQSYD